MLTLPSSAGAGRAKAAIGTVAVHVLILLALWLFKYNLPQTTNTPEELGMEVNLGTDADGSGDQQPMSVYAPAATQEDDAGGKAATQDAGVKDMMRSDDPDAPDVGATTATEVKKDNKESNHEPVKRPTSQDNAKAKDKPKPQAPRYTYQGGTGQGGNSAMDNVPGGSEGNTTGSGDRGVPGGTPGAANYEGSPGTGNGGISHTLSGRVISPARFEATFRESGRVTVRVTVDRDGNIIDKKVVKSPSPELSKIALQKLTQAKFTRSNSADPQQFGEVTIVFKARS